MPFQRIHRAVIAAIFLTTSAAFPLAQTSRANDGTAAKPGAATEGRAGSATAKPSAIDTTGMGGSRPGCGPSPGGSPLASAERPPGSTTGSPRVPEIVNDPTLGSSERAETGLGVDSVTPKNPKTGKLGDC
jgi:hypothetical protein